MPRYSFTIAGKTYDINSPRELGESDLRSVIDRVRGTTELRGISFDAPPKPEIPRFNFEQFRKPVPEPTNPGLIGRVADAAFTGLINFPKPEEQFHRVDPKIGHVYASPEEVKQVNDTFSNLLTSPAGLASVVSGVAPTSGIGRGINLGLGILQGSEGAQQLAEGNTARGLGNLGLGVLGMLGARKPKLPKMEVLPAETPIPKALGPGNEIKLLPAGQIPEESVTPRFVAGPAGIADTSSNYQSSLSGIPQYGKARIEDVIDATDATRISPEVAANYGLGPKTSPTPMNEIRWGIYNSAQKEAIAAGMTPAEAHKYGLLQAGIPDETQLGNRSRNSFTGIIDRGGQNVDLPPVGRRPVETPTNYPKMAGPVQDIVGSKQAAGIKKVLDAADKVKKTSPELAEVVSYPPALEQVKTKIGQANIFTVTKNMAQKISTELTNMGDAGRQLSWMLARASHSARERASVWDETYKQIKSVLSSDELEELRKAAISGTAHSNPKIEQARQALMRVDEQRNAFVQKAGVINPDTGEPFVPRKNYWPQIYPEGFWKDPKNIYSALKKKYPNIDEDAAIRISKGLGSDDLVSKVMSSANVDSETARRIIRIGLEKSERKIASQFSRDLDLPGARTDFDVWLEHNWDIARKTAEQEVFGRMDVADPNSPISRLIAQTPNPRYTEDLIRLQLGRTEKDRWARNIEGLAHKAASASSVLFLSQFALSNVANLNALALNAGLKNTGRAIIQAVISNRGASRELASEAGALYNVTKGILEATNKSLAAKYYGITWSENWNRTISAVAGRHAATDYFSTLKAGKLDKKYVQFLEDLTLTKADDLVKQEKLSESQLRMASGRMSEITQGLNEPRNLPAYWNNPYLQIPLIFKKYAFMQTAAFKDAIKRDPIKNGAIFLGLSQLSGEIIGDAKAGVRGSVSGLFGGETPGQAIENRGQYLGQFVPTENPAILRAMDNVLQSWMLGLTADIFFASTRGVDGLQDWIAGPVKPMAEIPIKGIQGAGGSFMDILNEGQPNFGENFTPFARDVLKRTPYVGSGLQRGLLPTPFQVRDSER